MMDAHYKLYCDFRDAYVAAHSSLKANQISINKFPFAVYVDVRKGEEVCPDVERDQFLRTSFMDDPKLQNLILVHSFLPTCTCI